MHTCWRIFFSSIEHVIVIYCITVCHGISVLAPLPLSMWNTFFYLFVCVCVSLEVEFLLYELISAIIINISVIVNAIMLYTADCSWLCDLVRARWCSFIVLLFCIGWAVNERRYYYPSFLDLVNNFVFFFVRNDVFSVKAWFLFYSISQWQIEWSQNRWIK